MQSGSLQDTIVACATPPGEGALAIVRLSGNGAPEILAALTGRAPGESHRMRLARLYDADGELLDQAMAVQMRRPSSYTGEDVVELYLHGSCAVVDAVLARTTALGARLADPGEFTLRAFLNGRMTLAEAEGVGDLIVARTETQRRVAARHAGGELARVVGELLASIEARLAAWRATFDFPDETGDDTSDDTTGDSAAVSDSLAELSRIEARLCSLVRSARADLRGRRSVVLCGAPNVGKSTLLNALVGERRVLVDRLPGTTRDPVEVEIEIGDSLARLSLIDTAGLRPNATGLEADGIALARAQIARADLILWLVDPTNPVWPDDDVFPDMIVATKADLADANHVKSLEKMSSTQGLEISVWTSGITDGGIHDLRRLLGGSPDVSSSDLVLLRRRHVEQMSIAAESLGRLAVNAAAGWTLDVLTAELEVAARALGEILGCDIDASVLDRIFSEFCIGK